MNQVAERAVWDWEFAWNVLPRIWGGMVVIIQATLLGITIAMILGLFLALGRRSQRKWIAWPFAAFIDFIRSTPLLIQLFFVFFALPDLGIVLTAMTSLVLGLGVHYATYASEAYRAGIEAVEAGQWEAATALNLGPATTWRKVILPQAIPKVIPALGNFLVAMIKDAPLGSSIGVVGVLFVARSVGSQTFRYVETMTIAGVLFLAVSIPAALFVQFLERKYGYEAA
ncbi:MAG TPA: ectoine/hydroxyectoine ABC transporter permease subunit EhuD [Acidimicrobiia bacterium]|nr:ectoine/hydroxyectoine ABC transporter permease subunit EhuD [Acidimicrobiia bacterium]